MTLTEAIDSYLTLKRSLGAVFSAESGLSTLRPEASVDLVPRFEAWLYCWAMVSLGFMLR